MRNFSVTKALTLIIIGGVLAGGALAARYMRGPVENPTTWRSLDHAVRDTSTEEYAVYSAVIDKLHLEDRLRVFVIRDHTAPCVRIEEGCSFRQIRNRFPYLKPETLGDYLAQNQESVALGQSFKLRRPAVMLADQDLSKLLVRTNLKVNLAPLSSRKVQWGLFYDLYPLSPGLISLSRVGFNSQVNQALLYEEIQGNDNGTWGRYLLLTKESGEWLISHQPGSRGWAISDKFELWFPEEPLPSVQHGEWGTLKGRILDAKAEGLDTVELDSLLCGWDIGSLREALGRDTVVMAEVTGKNTLTDKYGLRTWYRFKIIESLSEKPMPQYPTYASLPDPPEEMQPLKEDEFVILEVNGQMEIDGVRVIQRSNGVVYTVGGTYLLFLHIEPSKRVAVRSGTDPLGVFLVAKDGTFKAYIDMPYALRDQMARRYVNSIEKLRTALKTNPATP